MQRHWEGAHFREEVERRAEELASIALQDVDRYKWLPEWRHDLAHSVLGPRFEEEMVAETKIKKKKKKRVSGLKARRKTSCPNQFNDDLLHSKCRRLAESSDLLRFFSTQNGDLQKLLVDGIVNHNSQKGKDLAQKGCLTHKDGGEPTLACELDHKTGFTKDRKPTELGHSSCTAQSNPIPAEAAAPWGFRDWTYDLSTQQSSFEIEDFCTDELRPQTAGWTSNASCRLTNSSRPLSGWCGKADTGDGNKLESLALALILFPYIVFFPA